MMAVSARPASAPLAIRPMTEADLPAVQAIEHRSFPRPWDEAVFRAELAHPWSHCRVALRGGNLLGYIVFWSVADELDLLILASHPAHRREGIGRALVEDLLGHALATHARRVTLEVRRSNVPAVRLYERLGFAVVGTRPRYYQDDLEDALVMQLALLGAPMPEEVSINLLRAPSAASRVLPEILTYPQVCSGFAVLPFLASGAARDDSWTPLEPRPAPVGLYPILTERYLAPPDFPNAAQDLARAGVTTLQLRLKSLSDGACYEVYRAVSRRLADWPGTIVVNDRADLACLLSREARAEGRRHQVGLHLGQTDLPPERARAIIPDEVAIGLSTHTLEQVQAGLEAPVDYLAFGPIFPTRTKDDAPPSVGLERLLTAADLARAHRQRRGVVAIGGIDERSARVALAHGASAVAVAAALLAGGAGLYQRATAFVAAIGNGHG